MWYAVSRWLRKINKFGLTISHFVHNSPDDPDLDKHNGQNKVVRFATIKLAIEICTTFRELKLILNILSYIASIIQRVKETFEKLDLVKSLFEKGLEIRSYSELLHYALKASSPTELFEIIITRIDSRDG